MSWWSENVNKVSHLIRRGHFDDSFTEEMRLHIEERASELASSGMSHRDATAKARREFGCAARIAEESRDAWRWTPVEDLVRDLRNAIRTLRRDRAFAATAVLSLAAAIGINTTVFSLTTEFLFSQPSVRNPGNLVSAQIGGSSHAPMREYRFLRDAGVFDALTGSLDLQEANWRSGDVTRRVFVSRVTDNFFGVTGMPVALGRPFGTAELMVAVVSHGFWQSRLGADPAVLGRGITLDGKSYTIVGVLPPVHRTLTGFGYVPDMYLPVANESTYVALHGRLSAGMSFPAALDRLRSAAAELDKVHPDGNHKWADGVAVRSLVGIERLRFGFLRSIAAFFGLLIGVVGLLLIIACANVAGLLLARGSVRAQEFAIRMSIGAGRGRLIRQVLAETLLLSLAGTAAGLLLNYSLTRLVNRAVLPAPFPIGLAIEPDGRLLVYAAAVAIGTTLVAGLLPALTSTRMSTAAVLKRDEHQVSGRQTSARNALVAGQLAVSVLVLIMAALAVRNLVESARLDPGFDIRSTIWTQVRLVPDKYPTREKIRAAVAAMLDRVRSIPGVNDASVVTFVPLNDHFASSSSTFYTDEAPEGLWFEYSWNAVGPGYFNTMGIELIAGREFGNGDRSGGSRVAVINESFARRMFGTSNPIGQRIRQDATERVVVGVARNSKYSTLGERDRAALYEPYFQAGAARPTLQFMVKANVPPDSLLKALNATLLDIDPSSSIELKPMSRAMGFALLPSRAGAVMLGTVGSLGLALASVGLYGVLAYSVSRRTREIGLRVALGAQRRQVLKLVLKEGGWIVFAGLSIGALVALFVTRPLAKFLVPGLTASDPATYATVAGILVTVALAASIAPALRAMRIDPIAALRHE
jgi:predicted permease